MNGIVLDEVEIYAEMVLEQPGYAALCTDFDSLSHLDLDYKAIERNEIHSAESAKKLFDA